jgi:hypothetical protein
MFKWVAMLVLLGPNGSEAKIVLRGMNLSQEPGLPDEVQRIQEIADAADKKFYEESRKIIERMHLKHKKPAPKRLFATIDFSSSNDYDDQDM